MCGIAGFANQSAETSEGRLRRMCDTMIYRGPDGAGYSAMAGCALGMRRLAIIDVETGQQPMRNESGSITTVFNGEIYNYRELRDELRAKGYRFKTQSDTEVIPYLYEEYGEDFATRLNGIFAIAIWDASSQTLLLYRDRVGIKPLYYRETAEEILFGSEVKVVLAGNDRNLHLNPIGIDQLLTFEYTASPITLIEEIDKLPPAHVLRWRAGRAEVKPYWRLPEQPDFFDDSEPEIRERLRETVISATRRQMVSDVPLGAFLSGGVDSSILVAAMSHISERPPKTFSIGFSDSSYSELHFAREVAAHCGTDHTEAILEADFLSEVPTVISHLDQPIADFSVFPTLLVSRIAREQVTVALGGDGGDELFAGYDTYVAQRAASRSIDLLPRPLRRALFRVAQLLPLSDSKKGFSNVLQRFLEGASFPSSLQHVRWMMFQSSEQRSSLYTADFAAKVAGEAEAYVEQLLASLGSRDLDTQMRCDISFYLPENILTKVDLMSMASSLEARVPYLDNEVIDFALRIPPIMKWRRGRQKAILKDAFSPMLPKRINRRGKEGFSIPMKQWLAGTWKPLMHELLAPEAIGATGLFNSESLQRLMAEHERGIRNHSHLLWALMVFELWRRQFGPNLSVQ